MSNLPPPPPDESDFSSMPPPPPPPAANVGFESSSSGSMTFDTGETMELAEPWRRLIARLVDGVILFIVFSIFLGAVNEFVGLVVVAAYEIVFVALRGQTPGKMLLRIKVVRASNGYLPGWAPAAIRWAIPTMGLVLGWWLAGLPGLLVYASLLWNKRKQGWHDMAGKTLVVKT